MIYSQTRTQAGTVMPLLMGCTRPSPIETMSDEGKIIYDPMTQMSEMNMRTVGTYSLKSRATNRYTKSTATNNSRGTLVGSSPDKKNEIDDQKSVK